MNCTLTISKASDADIEAVLSIYAEARRFMENNGNPTQWGASGYPQEGLLKSDITNRRLYVIRAADVIVGAFVFVLGAEPTYAVIENGAWQSDRPYGTIHRLASNSSGLHAARACIDFCLQKAKEAGTELRADTHADNTVMRHILETNGFIYCGIIHVADGSPRRAYQHIQP